MSINEMLDNNEELEEELQDDEEEGVASDGEGNSGKTNKQISQAQINKIVEDRLSRERKKYSDYEDLKDIAENLKKYGYSGSVKEIREQLKQAVEMQMNEQELAKLEEEAEAYGTSPELLKKMRTLEKKIAELNSKEEKQKEVETQQAEQKAQMDAEWKAQKAEFSGKYPDVDLKGLAENKKFMKFAERANPNLTLTEVYEDFVELIGETEAEAIAKVTSKANRATYSGKGKGGSEGGTYGLTPSQQDLAKKSGITFKEYATRLREIQ